MMGRQIRPANTQKGAVLIVALIFLVVLTVAGITAMRYSTIEERMASNIQFRNQAFQLALSELRSQLLALNQNLANRAPLLIAMGNPTVISLPPGDPDLVLLNVLPDTTLQAQALTTKMPNNIASSQVRATTKPGLCSDSVNQGSSAGIDDGGAAGFKCLEFELSALAELASGANSSQAMGISFINN